MKSKTSVETGIVKTNRELQTVAQAVAAASAWLVSSLIPAYAQVNVPVSPVVRQGAVTIDQSNAAVTSITQTTQKAVINWSSFSIGAGNAVNFIQPDRNAIAVNRVTGNALSQIDGALNANGQVWVLNPNGVLFGAGAQINTAGFLATTRTLSDSDFIAGRYSFTAPLMQGGQIINRGTITSLTGGYVALVGQQVRNEGMIQANLGQVLLGGAQTFALDLNGDKLLSFTVTTPVSFQPLDGRALVDNSGVLQANGGVVQLSARAAADVVGSVINTSGLVQANSASLVNGNIVLDAGLSGTVANSGVITANGVNGGHVAINGKQIVQTGSIHADGSDGSGGDGGVVSLFASGSLYSAGSISANAGPNSAGNGGTITLISDLANSNSTTTMVGTLSAQAGNAGGSGGLIETSGSRLDIDSRASINTNAPKGKTGTWLLDPGEISIVAGSGGSSSTTAGTTFFMNSGSLGVTTLMQALGVSNVVIETDSSVSGNGNINVNAPVSWASNTLTLKAHNNINVNSSLDAGSSGSLKFKYGLATTDGSGSAVNVASNVEILIPNANAFQWQKGMSGTLTNLVLMNEYLRFGNGSAASINNSGAPTEPYYKDQSGQSCNSGDGWCKTSYLTTPLSFGLGFGSYSGNVNSGWNTDSVIYKTEDYWSQTAVIVPQGAGGLNGALNLPSLKLNIAGYKMGTGTIEAQYIFSHNNSDVKVSNAFSLGAGDRYLTTTTTVQAGTAALANIQLWTGISDDFLSGSDTVAKKKGNLDASGFSTTSATSKQANAVMVADPSNVAVSMLHSAVSTADAILVNTFGTFANVIATDPKSSAVQISSDGGYGIYAKMNDLAANEQAKITTYFGVALTADASAMYTQISAAAVRDAVKPATSPLPPDISLQSVLTSTLSVQVPTISTLLMSPVVQEPATTTATATAPAATTSTSTSTPSAPLTVTAVAPVPAATTPPVQLAPPAAAAPITAAAPTTAAPTTSGMPAVMPVSIVVPPPPSPVGAIKPPTPTDAADSGDRTLSAATPAPPRVAASQQRRNTAPTQSTITGMLSVQVLASASIPAAAAGEQRFSLGGNSSAW